ncbi:MAG TPA: DcaP family trimeric outer membrane transporter [Steroidobacteraceae bacterium]|jgi:hypothetical protein|nr:DcaP family trimeric outer membrane transporter [Steroidobacteraceae bacterium]
MTYFAQRTLRSITPLAAAIAAVLTSPIYAADAPAIQTAPIAPGALANTKFIYGGFIKFDALWSGYSEGQLANGASGSDFYVPGAIPVVAPAAPELTNGENLHMHAKQSRFQFGTDTDVTGGKISSRFEFDLYGTSLGNDRATNTYGLQLRHAYIQYKNWLVGQTWSNFQDAGALPETADYIGQVDGVVFVRQPQVRYTVGDFSVAAENPQTTITGTGAGAQITANNNSLPDITAAYSAKFPSGYVRFGLLARQLRYVSRSTTPASDIATSTTGFAGTIAGKISFGKDDIRFTVVGGSGIGRYVGLNFDNDAELNGTNNEIHAITGWGAYIAYRHVWTGTWRSTLMASESSYSNDRALVANTTVLNKGTASGAINLFYSPTPKLDIGAEVRVAQREVESTSYITATHPDATTTGQLRRVQLTAKYSF